MPSSPMIVLFLSLLVQQCIQVSGALSPLQSAPHPTKHYPRGSRLVQFTPCRNQAVTATVPMFVSKSYYSPDDPSDSASALGDIPDLDLAPDLSPSQEFGPNPADWFDLDRRSPNDPSIVRNVYITQHGLFRDANHAFSDVYSILRKQLRTKEFVLMAPAFYTEADGADKTSDGKASYFSPQSNLAWKSTDGSMGGDDASAPFIATRVPTSCSSYDVYDSLIEFAVQTYKNLETIYFVGHSNGAATLTRYSYFAPKKAEKANVRFIVANSPSQAFFTDDRPGAPPEQNRITSEGCQDWNEWIYGIGTQRQLPRYAKQKIVGKSAEDLFRDWATASITTLVGNLDTYSRSRFGDQTCSVHLQGGKNRRDRNYAFWAYLNLLAGPKAKPGADAFFGYHELKNQVKPVSGLSRFEHEFCVVNGVAHHTGQMWASQCGQSALLGRRLTGSDAPSRPA